MSNKKRERTAQHRLMVIDRIALDMTEKDTTEAIQKRREVVEDSNFRKLVTQGVLVEERNE